MNMQDWHPTDHRSPYRRIHPSHPGRKQRITWAEWINSNTIHTPDPHIYEWSHLGQWWELKEAHR